MRGWLAVSGLEIGDAALVDGAGGQVSAADEFPEPGG
jgi:hypothetical protein